MNVLLGLFLKDKALFLSADIRLEENILALEVLRIRTGALVVLQIVDRVTDQKIATPVSTPATLPVVLKVSLNS